MLPKMPKYAKNMRYAHFAKICEKYGKVSNTQQSHIRVFLTCPLNQYEPKKKKQNWRYNIRYHSTSAI